VEAVAAHETVSACDVERNYDAIAGFYMCDLVAHLLHDAHWFVAQNVALVDERPEQLVEMEVGPTDSRRGDPHYRVCGFSYGRIRHRVDADVAFAVPGNCLH
jgi:hypothetical protein